MASKIYTRGGDGGSTSLLSGKRVPKDHLRIKAYGALDELQSHLGMARALVDENDFAELIFEVQNDIFTASAELSWEGQKALLNKRLEEAAVQRLELWIDKYTAIYSLPGRFVVPGASQSSAALHVARTACRRSEQLIVAVHRKQADYDLLLIYFNRLSDLLFVLAWGLELKSIIKAAVRRVVSLEDK